MPLPKPTPALRPSTEKIRMLNDALRTTLQGGRVMMTAGVDALPPDILASVLSKMREFKDFSPANDPHGEHDFGSLEVNGHQVFFKIDYYDLKLEDGSEDPADPTKTTRVLTLMLATEY